MYELLVVARIAFLFWGRRDTLGGLDSANSGIIKVIRFLFVLDAEIISA